MSQPDATPERDTADQEARLATRLAHHRDSEAHKDPVYFTLGAVLVAVLGFALALLLAALHLGG